MKIDEAKARLQEALTQMWQHEAFSRGILENGIEEGLRDSSEDSRVEVPINQGGDRDGDGDGQTVRMGNMQPPIDITRALRILDDLPANASNSSSSSSRERDGDVVPIWSPSTSSFLETFVGEYTPYL
ncbi:unnamed protein product [Lactuca saligna]|uniref:Uncharacterized protein n=1 Tax=Lactuca saligna TaxID=75948 RepID=A0AA35VSC4_LACSI|nr:unnamed protein product [Lactuca saligna]